MMTKGRAKPKFHRQLQLRQTVWVGQSPAGADLFGQRSVVGLLWKNT